MKKFSVALTSGLLFLGSLPTPTFGQSAPAVEPTTGLIRGRDPEWSEPHLEYHGREEAHREYHLQKQEEHVRWHENHAAEEGSLAYEDEHRIMHEILNAMHRRAHAVEEKRAKAGVVAPGAHGGQSEEEQILNRDRPSRRGVRAEALAQVHADLREAPRFEHVPVQETE